MKKAYDFSRAKRAKFPGLPPIEELNRRTKVRITIMLDYDVLQHFKAQAAEPGADPYQTQINKALREYIGSQPRHANATAPADEQFISRLAERVAEYTVRHRQRRSRRARTKQ